MVTASDTSAHSPRTKESSGHDEIERDSNMGRSNHSPTDSQGDPMDTTPPAGPSMGPPQSSPDTEQVNPSTQGGEPTVEAEDGTNGMSSNHTGTGAPAAASAQQPKVVQTAFIHKLYNMLEDQSIQHLISWSNSNEGFVMSHSNEFSKVLAQYFKHANIPSFVRQLNMYGFHKVSDVFHTGSPESPVWEFKHGNGNFKRGDLVGLREIKRRASRHALVHRDSFSSASKSNMQPSSTQAEPPNADSTESRITNLEHTLYDMHARLLRSEDTNAILNSRHQVIVEGLVRSQQWSHDLSHILLGIVPDQESPIRRDLIAIQKDISRQAEQLRVLEESPESLLGGRQPYFSSLSLDSAPLSPRQIAQDDPRRPPPPGMARHTHFRPPMPNHLNASPRRYGSVGTAHALPTYRPQLPAQVPPPQHPLKSVSSQSQASNVGRRHTSADIRQHGWLPPGASPYGSGQSSTNWPPSPKRAPTAGDSSQQVRDVLSRYEIAPARPYGSRQTTPPLTNDTTPSTTSADSGWSFGAPKWAAKAADTSGPQTRRSSMASNVHSLLNPAETAERDEDDGTNDDRKRKRVS